VVLAKPTGQIRVHWLKGWPGAARRQYLATVKLPVLASSISAQGPIRHAHLARCLAKAAITLDGWWWEETNVEYVSATRPDRCISATAAARGRRHARKSMTFAGYDVTKEYVINDAGSQIDVLGRSVVPSRGA
jgi:hypothetical protein